MLPFFPREDNIKMDLKEIGIEDVNRIYLMQDRLL
jgi:hypothetical protein